MRSPLFLKTLAAASLKVLLATLVAFGPTFLVCLVLYLFQVPADSIEKFAGVSFLWPLLYLARFASASAKKPPTAEQTPQAAPEAAADGRRCPK